MRLKIYRECVLCKGTGVLMDYEGKSGQTVKCNNCDGNGGLEDGYLEIDDEVIVKMFDDAIERFMNKPFEGYSSSIMEIPK